MQNCSHTQGQASVGRANSKTMRQWGKLLWPFFQIRYHRFLRKKLISAAKYVCFKLRSLFFPKDLIFHLIRKYFLLLLFLFWTICTKGHAFELTFILLHCSGRQFYGRGKGILDWVRGNWVSDLICATLSLNDPEQITKIFWISHLKVAGLGEMIYNINSLMHLFPSSYKSKFEMAWKMHRAQHKYLRKPKQENKKGIDKKHWLTQNILWEPIWLVEADLGFGCKSPKDLRRERETWLLQSHSHCTMNIEVVQVGQSIYHCDLRGYPSGYQKDVWKTIILKVCSRYVKQFLQSDFLSHFSMQIAAITPKGLKQWPLNIHLCRFDLSQW